MKVALNATALLSPLTGIGQYTHQLALHLQRTAGIDLSLFYANGWSQEIRHTPLPIAARIKSLIRRWVPNSYALSRSVQQWNFTAGTREGKFDLYHEPNFLTYHFNGPTVITVHDLSWIRHPEVHPAERVRAMHKYFEPGLERASLIITDSEFVKKELIDVFGVCPEKIQPVLLGVEPVFHPQTAVEAHPVLSKYGLDYGSYLLAVGTLEPRKNLQVALHAFMRLPRKIRNQCPLILVGMKGWNTSELEREIGPLVKAGEIRRLGYIPREDLTAITAGAVTLIYPSTYEGFGLPPLEAMACGVAPVVSDVASLPEVVGDAGIRLDPRDIAAWTDAMQRMAEAPEERMQLGERARRRSMSFTWERCGKETVDVYKRALGLS